MKNVRFSTTPEVVKYTYSAADYDRSHIQKLGSPMSYSVQLQPSSSSRPFITPLDFSSLPGTSSSPSSPCIEKGKKQSKLTINTKMVAGPLFFTNLSTQYDHWSELEEEEQEEDIDDIPTMNMLRPVENITTLESY
ncbi:uncharacterized protein BX664DRAFT_325109 [Halteromyces radiatus]|uniref:uncharacterized protein n=1 Tax=Halteromyces radiatus TaxID=101107 RepID=UPI00221EC5A4|nr:uncharacterized protein BX664DRAFT_325109 [Halteromyces radiatus]KAI8096886.1 hypothetical protein BX664DRAFT_325109 [Halteromyces radiatus]